MKKIMLFSCISMISGILFFNANIKPLEADYSFEVVSENYKSKDTDDEVSKEIEETRDNMAAAKEIYRGIKESGTDQSVLEGRLNYNIKREQELIKKIELLDMIQTWSKKT